MIIHVTSNVRSFSPSMEASRGQQLFLPVPSSIPAMQRISLHPIEEYLLSIY